MKVAGHASGQEPEVWGRARPGQVGGLEATNTLLDSPTIPDRNASIPLLRLVLWVLVLILEQSKEEMKLGWSQVEARRRAI